MLHTAESGTGFASKSMVRADTAVLSLSKSESEGFGSVMSEQALAGTAANKSSTTRLAVKRPPTDVDVTLKFALQFPP